MYRFDEFLQIIEQPQNKHLGDLWKSTNLTWIPENAVWFPGMFKQGFNRNRTNKINNLRKEFCKQNFSNGFHLMGTTVWLFERKGDAMLFFMRWKGMTD